MREVAVESRLYDGVKRIGGLCLKFRSMTSGVPDRVVLLPGGRIFLVELKAPRGRLSPIQRVIHARMARLGITVVVLSNPDQVDEWLRQQEEL